LPSVTVRVDCGAEVIVGEGDSPSRKDAEKLAALSACIQLNNMGVVSATPLLIIFPNPS
jgi:dsRNA-specific ribonuclease